VRLGTDSVTAQQTCRARPRVPYSRGRLALRLLWLLVRLGTTARQPQAGLRPSRACGNRRRRFWAQPQAEARLRGLAGPGPSPQAEYDLGTLCRLDVGKLERHAPGDTVSQLAVCAASSAAAVAPLTPSACSDSSSVHMDITVHMHGRAHAHTQPTQSTSADRGAVSGHGVNSCSRAQAALSSVWTTYDLVPIALEGDAYQILGNRH
jgi:hypothetical protein